MIVDSDHKLHFITIVSVVVSKSSAFQAGGCEFEQVTFFSSPYGSSLVIIVIMNDCMHLLPVVS